MMADISGSNSDQEWLTIPELKTFDGGDVTFTSTLPQVVTATCGKAGKRLGE
jgi:hypothetical protein